VIAVAATFLVAWATWFLLARVPLYETSAVARIEAAGAAHPVHARIAGRTVRMNLAVDAPVRAGDVLVELEAEAERLGRGSAGAMPRSCA
jgi:membrane fusion protein (multidrug efflux system)